MLHFQAQPKKKGSSSSSNLKKEEKEKLLFYQYEIKRYRTYLEILEKRANSDSSSGDSHPRLLHSSPSSSSSEHQQYIAELQLQNLSNPPPSVLLEEPGDS